MRFGVIFTSIIDSYDVVDNQGESARRAGENLFKADQYLGGLGT
jgi:hypothetical protein